VNASPAAPAHGGLPPRPATAPATFSRAEEHMRTLYLHIGIWKTGTTTIQNTLLRNAGLLARHGIHYPDISANHTFLPSAFHPDPENFLVAKTRKLSGKALQEWHRQSLAAFDRGAAAHEVTIASSEYLLGLPEPAIARLMEYMRARFDQIRIVAYLRDPVDHVSSAINEQVKQGHYELETAYRIHGQAKEYSKLETWIAVVGRDNVIARPFSRSIFHNDDIVDDFLWSILGDRAPAVKKVEAEHNKSLSHAAVLIADRLASFAPAFSRQRGRSDYLFEIKGRPYQAPEALRNQVRASTAGLVEKLEREFSITFSGSSRAQEPPAEIWSEETIDSIARLLNRLSLENMRLESENARLLAQAAMKAGQPEEAEQHLKTAVRSGQNFEAFRDYAVFLKKQGRYLEAIPMCEAAIKLDDSKPWPKKLKDELVALARQA
jgi:hypothetical protein